jgi:predicted alpha/beta-hydrolase family hydrolase
MGGRTASMLAADGYACDGLLLFAYPLHPAGKPEKLRDAHLRSIPVPVLCLNGTRDALCRRDLMEHALASVGPNWRMHWLEGADHSFHVLKRSGRTDADVITTTASENDLLISAGDISFPNPPFNASSLEKGMLASVGEDEATLPPAGCDGSVFSFL